MEIFPPLSDRQNTLNAVLFLPLYVHPPSPIPARFFPPAHLSFHFHEDVLVPPPSQLLPSHLLLFPPALGILPPPSSLPRKSIFRVH